ncbi:glycosyltransferase [Bremerella cremea]|uniref:Glycosyltransferase n=1 Tax=Bremerella cremea TaxID=1031537 RepID=A0A368KM90_9BACT|nr:glycosyltransferase [Bremerella cremea]RCS43210.1 glycosyltransferase [Bremerella cremea]
MVSPRFWLVDVRNQIHTRARAGSQLSALIRTLSTFGRVAAEAMMNGILVVGSNRGALPEVIGDGGIPLEIPERITPSSRELITAEELVAWGDAITRLWDDQSLRQKMTRIAKVRSENWSVEQILADFELLVESLECSPNPDPSVMKDP